MWFNGFSWLGMILGGLFMLAFWGGIIFLVVWGVIYLSRRTASPAPKGTPLDVARERYAKGDIPREEFEQLRKDLS